MPSPRGKATAAPAPAAATRFTFEALPTITSASELTPLLRRQLVVDTRLGVGRTTTPDRIPASYLEMGVHRWRILDAGQPAYELVQNTIFFADSDEPLGIERIQGSFDATGRSTTRGLDLDLPYLAWELSRDWPHRRFDVDPPPPRGKRLVVDEGLTDLPWPPDATFV